MKKTLLLFVFISFGLVYAQEPGTSRKLGYGISPQGFLEDYSMIIDFFAEVGETCDGGVVLGNGAWRESPETSGIIPGLKFVSELDETYGYTDMLAFGWATYPELYLDHPDNPINNWTNEATKADYLQMLIHLADSLHPTYLFIGNEINNYWEQDSLDYMNMVDFYHQAYDSIKRYSPETQVGTIFNYESLAGKGELTGWTEPYWNAVNVFDLEKMDIVGLTVYPFFHYTHANDIPEDYLDDFFEHVGDLPVAITETGWPAESFIGSWECSETQQLNYIDKIFDLIEERNVPVINWLFLHYLLTDIESDAYKIFKSVSLRDSLHNDRPALDAWLSHCSYSSITETAKKEVLIYPNPTHGEVYFQGVEIESFSVYTTSGKEIISQTSFKSGTNFIDLSEVETGLYLLKIKTEDGTEHIKKISIYH